MTRVAISVRDRLNPQEDGKFGVYDGHRKAWGEVKAERRASAERNPEALIS